MNNWENTKEQIEAIELEPLVIKAVEWLQDLKEDVEQNGAYVLDLWGLVKRKKDEDETFDIDDILEMPTTCRGELWSSRFDSFVVEIIGESIDAISDDLCFSLDDCNELQEYEADKRCEIKDEAIQCWQQVLPSR